MLMGERSKLVNKIFDNTGEHQSYFGRLERTCHVEYCSYGCHRHRVLLMSHISGGNEYNLINTTHSKLTSRIENQAPYS